VGYIIFSTNRKTAILIARKLTMTDDPDEDTIRDAVGELANNIAGMFKSKYHEQYGGVYLGLPLVVAGNIRPFGGESKAPAEAPAAGAEGAMVRVQTKGVTIPFKSFDGEIYFQVMVYI